MGQESAASGGAAQPADANKDAANPTVLCVSGQGHVLAGRHAQAVQDFDRVLTIEPDNVWALGFRAEALRALGRRRRWPGSTGPSNWIRGMRGR